MSLYERNKNQRPSFTSEGKEPAMVASSTNTVGDYNLGLFSKTDNTEMKACPVLYKLITELFLDSRTRQSLP